MIRIFVGCAPNHEDAESQAVLEWSIRRYASEQVEIEWMKLSRDPKSWYYSDGNKGWQTSQWATPFSGFRWGIPARCNYRGKAIYMDSDVMVMADIAELWHQHIKAGKLALAKGDGSWRYCVSVWNCTECTWFDVEKLRADPGSHKFMVQSMANNPNLTQAFSGDWNCCDGAGHNNLDGGVVKAIHYTAMNTQPHLKYAIPRLAKEGRKHWFNGTVLPHPRVDLQELFDDMLRQAIKAGYTVESYCKDPLYGEMNKADLTNYIGTRA